VLDKYATGDGEGGVQYDMASHNTHAIIMPAEGKPVDVHVTIDRYDPPPFFKKEITKERALLFALDLSSINSKSGQNDSVRRVLTVSNLDAQDFQIVRDYVNNESHL